MKIKQMTMGILILMIFTLGIVATMSLELWATTSKKIPVKIEEGASSGAYNPADIRGSYAFAEISELYEIDLQVLYSAFDIPPETDGSVMKSKDLEALFEDTGVEIGNKSIKIFVALYKGLPIELDGSYLPENAVNVILEANKNLTEEEKNYLMTHQLNQK